MSAVRGTHVSDKINIMYNKRLLYNIYIYMYIDIILYSYVPICGLETVLTFVTRRAKKIKTNIV